MGKRYLTFHDFAFFCFINCFAMSKISPNKPVTMDKHTSCIARPIDPGLF